MRRQEARQHQDQCAHSDRKEAPPNPRQPRCRGMSSELIESGVQQSATACYRRQHRIEIPPMEANEFADSSLNLLCSYPTLPAAGKMFPKAFHTASRQLAI